MDVLIKYYKCDGIVKFYIKYLYDFTKSFINLYGRDKITIDASKNDVKELQIIIGYLFGVGGYDLDPEKAIGQASTLVLINQYKIKNHPATAVARRIIVDYYLSTNKPKNFGHLIKNNENFTELLNAFRYSNCNISRVKYPNAEKILICTTQYRSYKACNSIDPDEILKLTDKYDVHGFIYYFHVRAKALVDKFGYINNPYKEQINYLLDNYLLMFPNHQSSMEIKKIINNSPIQNANSSWQQSASVERIPAFKIVSEQQPIVETDINKEEEDKETALLVKKLLEAMKNAKANKILLGKKNITTKTNKPLTDDFIPL